jgi:DNA-binding MarR family transcriptional regulator
LSQSRRAGRDLRRRPVAAASDATRRGRLDGRIGFQLRMAQDASFRAFARDTGVRDLRPGRFAAMTVIHNNPGITQTTLSRAIARDKSTVTPLIQDLERRGLVARVRSRIDRRCIALRLTASGEDMLLVLEAHAASHDRRLDRIVGPAKPALIRLLKSITDGLA